MSRTEAVTEQIYIGSAPQRSGATEVEGGFVTIDGEVFYRIGSYDCMPRFFMSIVSASDHWMFISSNGALTAGRRNPEHALFPYYTDDKIHDSVDVTGSKTLVIVRKENKSFLWEPFSPRYEGVYDIRRNLYKNVEGDTILFEEVNRDLNVTFSYSWSTSDRYGFVRRSRLRNDGSVSVNVRILDGIQNLLPSGVDRRMQTESSTLLDAYKKSELLPDTGLGLFLLSSIPVDRPEPSEALRATTVWSAGLPNPTRLVSSAQLDTFRRGHPVTQETDVRASRGAYFVESRIDLDVGAIALWYLVAEVDQGPDAVAAINAALRDEGKLVRLLEEDVQSGGRQLRRLVASADGLQRTRDQMTASRHFSNVLFNIMRGGVFNDGYRIDRDDLADFISDRNRAVSEQQEDFLAGLAAETDVALLIRLASQTGDRQLERLCYEYLPLIFSRRHGDPSRPWNYFSIDMRGDRGEKLLSYQGNWRDIFQNWEALALSLPRFAESMICKFVSASTADGYNPYRVTRDGIDWETVDPADPWSYIGYWGDHQIIYLLRLLEISRDHHPGILERFLEKDIFAYANVPYRIKPYGDLLRDPHNTIDFNDDLEAEIVKRAERIGGDGKLVWNAEGEVHLVNLTEKLLVSVLAKLSNFIPGAGIWMNTQRPEWNDANNALVGYGVSMVTLYYLRRFLRFCLDLFESEPPDSVQVSGEVVLWFRDVFAALERHRGTLENPISDESRRRLLDDLGSAGSRYREVIYREGFSEGREPVDLSQLRDFFSLSLAYIDQTVAAGRRDDGLFHAYNLVSFRSEKVVPVRGLYEMLEGQVAVLTSGTLSASEAVALLDVMKSSELYRPDQNSYLLYPDRRLPRFVEKNRIPAERIAGSLLLRNLVETDDRRLVVRDVDGAYHFAGAFRNVDEVDSVMDELGEQGYREDVDRDRQLVRDVFEEVFDHESYTGRSGTFFGYEGLGSIYWHMVSKLLLAVGETFEQALDAEADPRVLGRLIDHYYEIRAGIGLNKSPEEFGAFPMDPYSHTPGDGGARQPGMTGQVKEDIIARWMELGLKVEAGRIVIRPALLRTEEFLTEPAAFRYVDVGGRERVVELPSDALGFTYCQVPFIFRNGSDTRIEITYAGGEVRKKTGLELDPETSASIFERSGEVDSVYVELIPGL